MSGDVDFELLYGGEFPKVLTTLQDYDSPADFVDAFHQSEKIRGDHFHVLLVLAMAASFDPDVQARFGIRLPVNPRTCERIPERWQQWLAHDPLTWVEDEACRASAKKIKAFWIDCGSKDQYHLQYGSRKLHDALERHGLKHHYEEFDGTHSGIDHRMDRALPWLYQELWA